MDIIQFFEEAEANGLVHFTLNEGERQQFLDSLPEDYCLNYISRKSLATQAGQNGMGESDFFEQFKIPETPAYANVRSGDFGEMLCFLLMKNKGSQNGITLVAPRKWRWKADKNKPCHGSDVVLFHRHDTNPSEHDRVEAIESKMKAVASNASPIQSAIVGAVDDKVKRLAKTLNWLHDRLATEGKPRLREAINRYRLLDENPTYQKKFHAVAILDNDFVDDEIGKDRSLEDNDIKVTVVSMQDLKTAYESTYNAMINSLP